LKIERNILVHTKKVLVIKTKLCIESNSKNWKDRVHIKKIDGGIEKIEKIKSSHKKT
jgi:hypothetical protein